MLRPLLEKTSYELLRGRKPNISHLRAFGCKCFVHNNGKDNLGKFDARSDEGIFLGYSLESRAYKVFNKRTQKIEESIHVAFDESKKGTDKEEDEDEDFSLPYDEERSVPLPKTHIHQVPEENVDPFNNSPEKGLV